MSRNKMSDLDANQIIKIAHDPKTGALHVNKLNSLVPAAYGKVELNYISVNDEDVIDTATFYGDGEFEVTGIGINDDVAGSLNGSYFLINSANDETEYYVWLNNGTASDPALVGKTGIEVAYNNNDSKHRLSFKLASSLNSVLDFGAEAQADALLITNVTQGETTPTQDNNTGFQFYQIKQGSSRKVVAILQMTYDAFANLIAAERVFYG